MAIDGDDRSLTDRVLDVVASLWPSPTPAAEPDAGASGTLAELGSWVERTLGGWLSSRARSRARLDGGLDRLATVGRAVELAARLEPGTPAGLEVGFAVDGVAVGVARTSDLPATVCSHAPAAIGVHVVTSTVRAADGEVLVAPAPIARLQVVGDGPVIVADTRLLDGDATALAALRGLDAEGVTLCWVELAAPDAVAARHAQLAAAGWPPAAVLAIGARDQHFEQLGVDFGAVNARLLLRRIRAAGVPLIAAVTRPDAADGPAAVGLASLTLAQLAAMRAAPGGLTALHAAAAGFVAARDGATGPDALAHRHEIMTSAAAVDGNAIELELDNHAARTALFADLDAATRSIHLQFYILKEGRFATELVERLRARAAAGVAVRLVVDALYSGHEFLGRTNPVIAALTDQPGIEIRASDPVAVSDVDAVALKQRDHRKLALVDGTIGYVSGRNGADEYYLGFDEVAIDDATPHDHIPWLDAHARVRGPLVAELERVFAANWRRNGGGELAIAPTPAPAGDVRARVVMHDGVDDARALASYDALFGGARERIIVVNDFPLIADLALALIAAAQRGVRVDLLTGNGLARRGDGTFFDGPRHRELFEYLVKHGYEPLLAAGVAVHEYAAPNLPNIVARGGAIRPYVHAKVAVVDGCIASVGSANLDVTASHWERELNLIIESTAIAGALTAQLDALIERGHRLDPSSEAWQREAPRRALARTLWPDRVYQ